MKLIAIPIDDAALHASSPHWLPFLPMIASRTKETAADLSAASWRRKCGWCWCGMKRSSARSR